MVVRLQPQDAITSGSRATIPLTRAVGQQLEKERLALRLGTAELAALAGIPEAHLQAAEAGELPIGSMTWVWAWAALTQARQVFAGHEELPRQVRRRQRKPEKVARPRRVEAPLPVAEPEPGLPIVPEMPSAVAETLAPEAAAAVAEELPLPVVPEARPLEVVLRPQLSEAPLEPSIRPNGRCLHGMDARWCAPCLGVERRALPTDEEPRRERRYLGPLKPDVRPDLRDNYRPKRSVLPTTWGPSKENNLGAARARKNIDGKGHERAPSRPEASASVMTPTEARAVAGPWTITGE